MALDAPSLRTPTEGPPTTLRLLAGPDADGADAGVVLDVAFTPAAADAGRLVPVRPTVDRVLRDTDLIAEASDLLDAWAAASGIVDRLAVNDTSFWYYVRLRHWNWLQERVLWARVVRALLDDGGARAIHVGRGADPALVDVARIIAAADGLGLTVDASDPPGAGPLTSPASTPPAPTAVHRGAAAFLARLARRAVRLVTRRSKPSRPAADPEARARAAAQERLEAFAAEPGRRLLVVSTHHRHRVDTPDGPRMMNPYLGTVTDRLRGTPLDPIQIDWRREGPPDGDDQGPARDDRMLPRAAALVDDRPVDPAVTERALAAARAIADIRVPVTVCGVDLGPALAAQVAASAMTWFPQVHRQVARIGRLLAVLRPAGILMADEYHRQDWREAAAAAGIPVAAVQHGTINRHHRGYVHPDRPPRLRLPDRTYVFGRWEHDRLVRDSVYREDEVVVAGSPRLDLVRPEPAAREPVRRELGVRDGDRMVVLSGTWGPLHRRFHYPVVLARLFDRPIEGVHLVVKQHPAEMDEGPYRSVIEGVARAAGFAPPPITVVRDVDLYRLLGAADAHLGVHSTVLTEAVFVGVPNLLAAGIQGGDLLDYVAAGVALPVSDGADLLAALERVAAGAITDEARAAFLARQFEPGNATQRIADDLLEWLTGAAR